jgi:hypothetical protein
MTNSTTALWSIYFSAPDEYHAATSEAMAQQMATQHNAAMSAYFEKHPPANDFMRRMQTGCLAVVAPYPWSAEEHAEALQDFNPAEWGLEGGAT